jgi:hypothetical protein
MDHKEWAKVAVTLVLQPSIFKSKAVSVISECPKCFKSSWVHQDMLLFDCYDYPKRWTEAVAKRYSAVKLAALREWGGSLCHKCKNLTGGTVDCGAYRTCSIGMGPAKSECESFVPIDTAKESRRVECPR